MVGCGKKAEGPRAGVFLESGNQPPPNQLEDSQWGHSGAEIELGVF